MRIVVTGIGPRTGTSAMMRRLVNKGYSFIGARFPKHGVPKHNPEGYFELELDDYCRRYVLEGDQCIKMWPGMLHLLQPSQVDLLIVMKRPDRDAQIMSGIKVGTDEGIPNLDETKVDALINVCEGQLLPWLTKFNHVIIHTDEQDRVEAYL